MTLYQTGRRRIGIVSLLTVTMIVVVVFAIAGWVAPFAAAILGALMGSGAILAMSRRRASPVVKSDNVTSSLTPAILEAMPDAVIVLGRNREIITANAAACTLLGSDLDNRDLAVALRHPMVLEAADAVISGAENQVTEEISLAVPVPCVYQLLITALADQDKGGAVALLVLHNITDAKTAEKMRAEFVANVSHELRSPLSTLVGLIETLSGPARDDEKASERFLSIMEGEASRMTFLIDDLLSLSKLEAREHVRPEDHIDVEKLLGGVVDTIAIRAKERDMPIKLNIEPGLSPALGDEEELEKVFRNLLDNAISYGSQKTPIIVTLQAVERIPESGVPGLSIAVSNQGDGIPPEHLPRLTERFYRVDKGRSRSMGGTGLGLAIIKHIVSRHRGQLAIESTVGEGSTFTVMLPTE